MKLNSKMKEFVDSNGLNLDVPPQLPEALAAILKPGFVRVNGAIVLKALTQGAKAISLADFPDETGYESFVNHIHIEDYVPHEHRSALVLMANGISLASRVLGLLRQSYPTEEFDVIVSFQENHCTVRFHKKRTGQQLLRDNLDDYKEEALMVLQA